MISASSFAFAFSASSTSRIHQPHHNYYHHSTHRRMFSTGESESSTAQTSTSTTVNTAGPLEVVETSTNIEETQPTIRTSTPVQRPKMVAKNMNTGEIKEVKWVDPAMQANTNPLQMDWYVFDRSYRRLYIIILNANNCIRNIATHP